MEMSSDIERIILENPVESQMWSASRKNGMLTMREDAILKAFDKKVPFTEVETLAANVQDLDEEQPLAPQPQGPPVAPSATMPNESEKDV